MRERACSRVRESAHAEERWKKRKRDRAREGERGKGDIEINRRIDEEKTKEDLR